MATTIAAITVTAVAALAGCTPAPMPTPTPTAAFASEEEAFAAAEEVYRAYNDAGNARRAGTPDADPQQYLTGIALEGDIDTQNLLLSRGLRATGSALIESIRGESSALTGSIGTLTTVVCIDVSGVSLLDADGNDVTPPERGDRVVQRVTLMGDKDSLLISDAANAQGESC